MQRRSVSSSVLSAVTYDETNGTLEAEFRNGRTYRYYAVPRDVFDALLAAESIGEYLNREIKPKYDARQVSRGAAACPPPDAERPSRGSR